MAIYFKAQVRNGRLVLDAPTRAPDGRIVYLEHVDRGAREGRETLDQAIEAYIRERELGVRVALALRSPASPPRVSEFDQWVSDNNIPERYDYRKGWWDYVELVRRFACEIDADDVRIVGHYRVHTPPPEEVLPMPAVALVRNDLTVALKWDFGSGCRWPHEWTVSVRRRSPYRGPTFGLFDASLDERSRRVEGLEPSWVFPPLRESPAAFTCALEDEWDVAVLLRLVSHEP